MNISGDFVKGLIKDSYGYMLEKYDSIAEIWPQIYEEKTIDGDFWKETTVVNSGTWRKTSETEGFVAQPLMEGYTVYGRIFNYCQAAHFSKIAIADHQKIKDLLKATAGGWGETAKETREEFYARPFNRGGITTGDWSFNGTPESKADTDPSGDLFYDSTCWFPLTGGTKHTSKGGGKYYNGFAYDLNPDNLKAMWLHYVSVNNRRENDTQMRNAPDTIYYPPAMEMKMREILNSTLVPYGSTNTTNVLQALVQPIQNPYLETATFFDLMAKKKGKVALKRQEPVIDFFEDKLHRCWWATAEMRIGLMIKNFRFDCASNAPTV